jgi:hypothetical protein
MKRALLFLAVSLLSHQLLAGEKFPQLLDAIRNQDLALVRSCLNGEEVLTPEQFELLTNEATTIYKKLRDGLSIFTSKRDTALLIIGSLIALSTTAIGCNYLSVGLGWTRDHYVEQINHDDPYWKNPSGPQYDDNDPEWFNKAPAGYSYRDNTDEERNGYLLSAVQMAAAAVFSGYMAFRGYRCINGRVPVENAGLIVEELKKAEKHTFDA